MHIYFNGLIMLFGVLSLLRVHPATAASEEEISDAGRCVGHFAVVGFFSGQSSGDVEAANQMIETTRAAIQAARGKSGRATYAFPVNFYLGELARLDQENLHRTARESEVHCSTWVQRVWDDVERCNRVKLQMRGRGDDRAALSQFFEECFSKPRPARRVDDERLQNVLTAYGSYVAAGTPTFRLGGGNPFAEREQRGEGNPFFQ